MHFPATFELPTTDTLTGLLRPIYFRHMLREELLPAADQHHDTLSLFLLDLDGFAEINQRYGQECGDAVLKAVAQTLTTHLPASALIVRYGGDEFGAALPNTRSDELFMRLEDIRRAVPELRFPQWPELRLTCSAGIASYQTHARDDIELLREADQALYMSKISGRNRISLPPSEGRMITKTSYYTPLQLERLSQLARRTNRNEASILREALDEVLKKYNEL